MSVKNWDALTLDEVCLKITDGAHSSPPSIPVGKPMASVKDLTPYGIYLESCRRISDEDFKKLVKQGCQPMKGDVLIAKDGATALNTVCEVKKTEEVVLLSSVAILRPNPSIIDFSYLHYFLDASTTRSYLKSNFISGAAIPRIVLKDLKRAIVTVPPLSIQQRIAGILSAYDELIENSQRRIKILETMARALYREWFVHFRFPGFESVPRVPSPLGEIPQGWEVTTFAKAAVFENGDRGKNYPSGSDFVDEGIPFINAGHLADGGVDFVGMNYITVDKFDQLRSGKIRKGDLLYCLRGSPGRTARIAALSRGAIASSLVIIRPSEHANEAFLYYTLGGEIGKRLAIELDNGAAQPNVSVGSIQKYPLLLPPIDLLGKFTSSIEPIWRQIEVLRSRVSNLKNQRDLLLPRLLSGQIDVEAMPE